MPQLDKYKFFEDGYAQLAVELGLMSPSHFQKFIHFKVYLHLRDEGFKKRDAIEITADKTHSSYSTVWRSVAFFNS